MFCSNHEAAFFGDFAGDLPAAAALATGDLGGGDMCADLATCLFMSGELGDAVGDDAWEATFEGVEFWLIASEVGGRGVWGGETVEALLWPRRCLLWGLSSGLLHLGSGDSGGGLGMTGGGGM